MLSKKSLHKKIRIPVNFRFLVWLSIIMLFVFGLALMLQGQMDLQNYQHQIKRIVKERTDREIYIRGGVNVVLLPVPTIYVSGVELRDLNNGRPVPALTAELLLITPEVGSLFSDQLEISSIALRNPTLEIERAPDGIIHWDWLEKEFLHLLDTASGTTTKNLDISGGSVVYRNSLTGRRLQVSDIDIEGQTGSQPDVSGNMTFNGQRFSFGMTGKGEVQKDDYMPFGITVSSDSENYVKLDGKAKISSQDLDVKGLLQVDIKDIYPWITLRKKDSKELDAFLRGSRDTGQRQSSLPVKFTGTWDQTGDTVLLSDLQWDGLSSKGAGTLTASFKEEISVDSKIHFTELNYGQWKQLIQIISEELAVDNKNRYVIDESLRANILPGDVRMNFDLTSDKLLIRSQIWENVKVSVDMVDSALTINQFMIELPGASTLALFGVVSQNATTRGMRFEGSIETEGKSLKEVLSIFDESVRDLPDVGFEEFFVRSNIYISNDQIRLSESDVRFDDLQLGGGLVIYYDAHNPRIEADVRLQDTNFDYFRDIWRERKKTSEPDDFFLKFDKNLNFSWLTRLETVIDLKINVDNFTFLERSGDRAYLRLYARQGELGIYNVRFYYPEDTMEMNLTLNVQGKKPFVKMLLNANEIDTAYFSPVAKEKDDEEEEAEQGAEEAAAEGDTETEPEAQPATDEALTNLVPEAGGTDTLESIVNIKPQSQRPLVFAQNRGGTRPSHIRAGDTGWALDAEKNSQNKRWSEELIDMSWMEGMEGVFDVTIGKLQHGDMLLENIKMNSSMENRLITIKEVTFKYWGGKCRITGNLYGGKVPGIAIGFTLFNIELGDLIASVSEYENISGKASLSGSLSTSGVNFLSWLSQAEAKVAIRGRGVQVKGFNLDGAVNTVKVARTAADVLNNVNRALVNGNTRMSLDGNINVRNGVLRSPGITLKSGGSIGSLTGDISVVPWTMDIATLFQFPAMSSDTIPTLLVQLNGSIDDPALTTDTSSLEAFVVKSIKQK